MRPELWAALTAICWGVGSFFEKKGVKMGNFTPVMGTAIRTGVSLLILAAASSPFWGQIPRAGWKPVLMIAVGGGVLAGAVGLLCFYNGLASGELSKVMVIAFCLTPVIGAAMGMAILGEGHSPLRIAGMVLAVLGAGLVTIG